MGDASAGSRQLGGTEREGLTTFPLSHSLPSSPVTAEDGTFSILPRYLLQKVKSTFVSNSTPTSGMDGPAASQKAAAQSARSDLGGDGHGSTGLSGRVGQIQAGTGRLSPAQQLRRDVLEGNSSKSAGAASGRATPSSIRPQPPSNSGSTVSRGPRLSSGLTGNARRAAAPVLSKTSSETGNFATFATSSPSLLSHSHHAGPLSRSHPRSLGTLPESPVDGNSPPPPYSASNAYQSIPGFPLGQNDDAKSVSSVAPPNPGVAHIFRRLRGEALSRDYWMSDESAVDCYDCNTAFTTWRRKHHCRVCGRIFCSRCASNIIPGARFGHEGLVRVCNLCLAILTHQVERSGSNVTGAVPASHPHDDLHSSTNDRSNLQSSSSVANLNISLPLESSFQAPQSQFSASVLFPRNEFSNYNLAAIANFSSDDLTQLNQSKRGRRFSDVSFARPETPDMFEESASPTAWHPTLGSPLTLGQRGGFSSSVRSVSPMPHVAPATTPAPFRKTAADEDKALPSPQPQFSSREDSPMSGYNPSETSNVAPSGLGIYSPTMPAVMEPTLSDLPISVDPSYESSLVGGLTSSSGRPETPSAGLYLPSFQQPNIRSRLNSRAADQVFDLADIDTRRLSEVGYLPQMFRTQSRSLSFVNDVELAAAALGHVRRLLSQCLKQAQVPRYHMWEEELLKILVKVARYPLPKVKEGDSMDVRNYVKIKRVPGGSPADCEYVDGVVFTKSLLNKTLPRFVPNPRIMVFNYAFEFEHDETKIARLDTLRDSEKDSLRKLANSIIDHRPHIVLVGKNVSGLALDYLHKANIVVARNVKPSVLDLVARCTRAGIFNTYQHFPETTRLGRCSVFRADTIVHNLIPGKRKTLMRFEGCSKDLGGTIMLRGGDLDTLTKIKKVMKFMVLAVYSIRLEMCFFWDEHAAIPPAIELARMRELPDDDDVTKEEGSAAASDTPQNPASDAALKARARADMQRETAKLISRALKPYTTVILSTSPTVIYPPPHSLNRLKIDNDKVEEMQSEEKHIKERTITASHEMSSDSLCLAAPATVSKGGEPEAALQTSSALTRSLSEVSLLSVKPQTKTKVLRISAELANASQIAAAEARRDEHLLIWEKRLVRHQDDFSPTSHQHLSVLETVICSTKEMTKACQGPRLRRFHYYRKGSDMTLREYIENVFANASRPCESKNCNNMMKFHYTVYAHGQQSLSIVVDGFTPSDLGSDEILMFSFCTICEYRTDVTSLSIEASNYSFAKYLELSFYHDQLFCRALACPHNIHEFHQRYFVYKGLTLRAFVSQIDVFDVAIPSLKIRTDPWIQLRIKNEEYRSLQKVVTSYWDSVLARIHAFNYDLLPFDRHEAGRTAMQTFEERATEDKATFAEILDKAYDNADPTRPSSMNQVRQALAKKITEWDTDFITFEQNFIPSDAERARRMTSSHLRRLFSDPNSSAPASPDLRGGFSPLPSVPPSPMLPAQGQGIGLYAVPPSTLMSLDNSSTSTIVSAESASNSSSSPPLNLSISRDAPPEVPRIDLPPADLEIHDSHEELPDTPQATLSPAGGNYPITRVHPSDPEARQVIESQDPQIRGGPTADNEDASSDSDSTVCAEPPRAGEVFDAFDSMRSESEDLDVGLAMRPYKSRRTKPVPSIANLVQRFEANQADQPLPPKLRQSMLPIPSTSKPPTDTVKSPSRPGMRRGKSDYTDIKNAHANQSKEKNERNSVLSDGDVPASAPPIMAAMNRNSRHSKSPGRNAPAAAGSLRRRPPMENRPSWSSNGSGNLELPLDSRPPNLTRTSTASSRSTVLGSGARRKVHTRSPHSGSPDEDSKVKPTLKIPHRDQPVPSPRPSPGYGPRPPKRVASGTGFGPNSRVTSMARHFNHLSREAERERQRQLVLARRKTARPVIAPRATANVFTSNKEALKDDSDDGNSSSGADDEMGPEEDEDKLEAAKSELQQVKSSGHHASEASSTYRYDPSPSKSHNRGDLSASSTSSSISLLSSEGSHSMDATTSTGTGTDSAPSVPPSPYIGTDTASMMTRMSHLSESEMSSTGTESRSLMKALSSLWNYRGADFIPLEYPTNGVEHLIEGSNIVVREDEPSSIIAHGLTSSVYKDKLKLGRPRPRDGKHPVRAGEEPFMPNGEEGHGPPRGSDWGLVGWESAALGSGEIDDSAIKKPEQPEEHRHIKCDWDAETFTWSMRVFFADQFDKLRKDCKVDQIFIESLARCVKWDAVGGKSGSAFLKTKDDRFIIKEISPPEQSAFLQFAPNYFDYMDHALHRELPTVLAKVLGVFRINTRNNRTGKTKKLNVLVIENIYYGKNITTQYDLKGSVRNRLVAVDNKKETVLLDENLTKIFHECPLAVREHTKKHLETALYNDSLFLSCNKVMDYSLIVGVDRESKELVVGIIDFLRPYTWDKRLETWVKETAYLGGGAREPTILNPRTYKLRFREAMARYFVLMPDRWTSSEAIRTGQPQQVTPTPANPKGKAGQLNAIIDDQNEQYAGGSSRSQSPAAVAARKAAM